MRTFFAIDAYSTLRLSIVRKLLALRLSKQLFEVLPLEEERFSCPRDSLNALLKLAEHEGKKVLEHYQDAPRCVVVFGFKTHILGRPQEAARFDYAAIVERGKANITHHRLNPPVPGRENLIWASSPNLQPELAEALLEVSGLGP